MNRSDASKFAERTIARLVYVPSLTEDQLKRLRDHRERLKAKILAVLWDEFGPFDDKVDIEKDEAHAL